MIAITSFGTADDCKKSVAGVTKIILKWVPLDASQNLRGGLRPRIMKAANREDFLMPRMSTFEIAIASAIVGVLVLWFGIYLWRERRDR